MHEQQAFVTNLRRARERCGVSLDALTARTKVPVAVWEALEANDLSRWPSGLYARACVRAYAQGVGLDPHQAVEEFCRWFPVADRRAARTIRAQAELIGVPSQLQDDWRAGARHDRRRADADAVAARRAVRWKIRRGRLMAASIDAAAIGLIATIGALAWRGVNWPLLAVTAIGYHGLGTALGGTPGSIFAERYYPSIATLLVLRRGPGRPRAAARIP